MTRLLYGNKNNVSSESGKAMNWADIMFTDMITELNLPIAAGTIIINKVVKKAFPDLPIAKFIYMGL